MILWDCHSNDRPVIVADFSDGKPPPPAQLKYWRIGQRGMHVFDSQIDKYIHPANCKICRAWV
ncbi:MAG: hypothetical protein JO297_00250 [Nitrososphaeraceae archaeon]|nr:hypothetical protein [Nitrososphaeraceae archaeon]